MYRMHVYEDLTPYICTFSGCKDGLEMFPTRKLWADHEFSQHRTTTYWRCSECLVETSTPQSLSTHLREAHQFIFSKKNLASILSSSEKMKETVENMSCPLCQGHPGDSHWAFISHMCRHMEYIALASLPRDPDSESDQSSQSSGGSEHQIPQPTNCAPDPVLFESQVYYEGWAKRPQEHTAKHAQKLVFENEQRVQREELELALWRPSKETDYREGVQTESPMSQATTTVDDAPRRSREEGYRRDNEPFHRGPPVSGRWAFIPDERPRGSKRASRAPSQLPPEDRHPRSSSRVREDSSKSLGEIEAPARRKSAPSRSSSPNGPAVEERENCSIWRAPQPSQGDFVLIDSLTRGQRPDLSAIAGEDPLVVDAPLESELYQPQEQQPTRCAPQVSSYWSVSEQNEFPRLLAIYGTDWQQIANGLKNKTAVMVCRHELIRIDW